MKISILLISSFLIFSVNEKSEWKKRKEKSGIVVYTRTIEGAPMDEFKCETTFTNTNLTEVLSVISDIEDYPRWLPDCMEAEVLHKKEEYHSIHYIAIKAPWPVTKRDAIYEMTTTLNSENTFARIDLEPRGDYIGEKKNFVRLYKGCGFWELEEMKENMVKVTYQFSGDPGGKVPVWLANSYVVSNPFHTLSNLRKFLKR